MAFPHKRPRLMEDQLSFEDDDKRSEVGKTKPSAIFNSRTNDNANQLQLNLA
jgi:hypothetical protein